MPAKTEWIILLVGANRDSPLQREIRRNALLMRDECSKKAITYPCCLPLPSERILTHTGEGL